MQNPPPLRNPYDFSSSFNDYSGISSSQSPDQVVQDTNEDAGGARLSAAKLGYIGDRHVETFVRRFQKRSPLINRGSYLRYECINRLMLEFIKKHQKQCQIISLGAGSDTRYFTLKDEDLLPRKYYELDFEDVVMKKMMTIRRSRILSQQYLIDPIESHGHNLDSKFYHLISADLRKWPDTVEKLKSRQLDSNLPTLILSECVLIYMDTEYANTIIKWAGEAFEEAAFLTYEQILPHDSFGKMMISNLQTRSITLKSIFDYPDLESQQHRYLKFNWESCEAADMIMIYEKTISDDEKRRISKIELLDELEEWVALCKHYCMVWATKGQQSKQIKLLNC